VKKLRAANQTAGCFASVGADLPESPVVVMLLPLGIAAVVATTVVNRRRRRRVGA
jgi:hypothetical protein